MRKDPGVHLTRHRRPHALVELAHSRAHHHACTGLRQGTSVGRGGGAAVPRGGRAHRCRADRPGQAEPQRPTEPAASRAPEQRDGDRHLRRPSPVHERWFCQDDLAVVPVCDLQHQLTIVAAIRPPASASTTTPPLLRSVSGRTAAAGEGVAGARSRYDLAELGGGECRCMRDEAQSVEQRLHPDPARRRRPCGRTRESAISREGVASTATTLEPPPRR